MQRKEIAEYESRNVNLSIRIGCNIKRKNDSVRIMYYKMLQPDTHIYLSKYTYSYL